MIVDDSDCLRMCGGILHFFVCHTVGKGFSIDLTSVIELHQLSHYKTRMTQSEISDKTLKMSQCSRVPDSAAFTHVNNGFSFTVPNERLI